MTKTACREPCSSSLFTGLFIDHLFNPDCSTDDFPLAREYNIGRKGDLWYEQRRNGSHRNYQLDFRASVPGACFYNFWCRALGLPRLAPSDRMAGHIQGHPRSTDKQEEKVGK